jgi:hypothetical protein
MTLDPQWETIKYSACELCSETLKAAISLHGWSSANLVAKEETGENG